MIARFFFVLTLIFFISLEASAEDLLGVDAFCKNGEDFERVVEAWKTGDDEAFFSIFDDPESACLHVRRQFGRSLPGIKLRELPGAILSSDGSCSVVLVIRIPVSEDPNEEYVALGPAKDGACGIPL